jgi:hypothetical protein
MAFIRFSHLQGQDRSDLVARLHALEFVPFVVALWGLLHQFGLIGAALAWPARCPATAPAMRTVAKPTSMTGWQTVFR